MVCELLGRPNAQCAVGPDGMVIVPPALHDGPGQGKAREPMLVEALDIRVLHRLAGLDEVQPHPMGVRPSVEDPPSEFRAIVSGDQLRYATVNGQPVQHPRHAKARQRRVHFCGKALSGEIIDHG